MSTLDADPFTTRTTQVCISPKRLGPCPSGAGCAGSVRIVPSTKFGYTFLESVCDTCGHMWGVNVTEKHSRGRFKGYHGNLLQRLWFWLKPAYSK